MLLLETFRNATLTVTGTFSGARRLWRHRSMRIWNAHYRRPNRKCHHMTVCAADNCNQNVQPTVDPLYTVYPKKYGHGFCFAVLCGGYTLTAFPISIRLTSLALWQSNDCPSASKATLMNMDKYSMWIHYERLHNHNKAKHNKTVCILLGIYCKGHPIWWPFTRGGLSLGVK